MTARLVPPARPAEVWGAGPIPEAATSAAAAAALAIDGAEGRVRVFGELDLSCGDALADAVAWLRRDDVDRRVTIDTTPLRFVDVAGHRLLRSALCRPDGTRDPRIVHVVGAAVARFERLLSTAVRPR